MTELNDVLKVLEINQRQLKKVNETVAMTDQRNEAQRFSDNLANVEAVKRRLRERKRTNEQNYEKDLEHLVFMSGQKSALQAI